MKLFNRNKFNKSTDEELILLYQKTKDKAIVGELFNRYYHMVFGVGLKYLKNSDEAQDITMIAFESLFEKLLQNEVRNFKSWLYRLSCNECLMKLRKESKTSTTEIETLEYRLESNSDELKEKEKQELTFSKLEEGIESLKEEQKICIRMFYLEERSYNEIAAKTDFTLKQVKSFIQNGKRNLKMKMQEGDF
ncbi:MAG: sigma-70 family RNA polymerase sigma factor [Crocinitomicaceae bacterium]|nr:sigma-70 family RNA polymerase sigma factor [Crocinitomicaceae bacterium]